MAFPSRKRDDAPLPDSSMAPAALPPIPPDSGAEETGERISAESAGYMELGGAQKDGDCKVVEVPGGLSKNLGCCNIYKDPGGSQVFSCGTCYYVTDGGQATQAVGLPDSPDSSPRQDQV